MSGKIKNLAQAKKALGYDDLSKLPAEKSNLAMEVLSRIFSKEVAEQFCNALPQMINWGKAALDYVRELSNGMTEADRLQLENVTNALRKCASEPTSDLTPTERAEYYSRLYDFVREGRHIADRCHDRSAQKRFFIGFGSGIVTTLLGVAVVVLLGGNESNNGRDY